MDAVRADVDADLSSDQTFASKIKEAICFSIISAVNAVFGAAKADVDADLNSDQTFGSKIKENHWFSIVSAVKALFGAAKAEVDADLPLTRLSLAKSNKTKLSFAWDCRPHAVFIMLSWMLPSMLPCLLS